MSVIDTLVSKLLLIRNRLDAVVIFIHLATLPDIILLCARSLRLPQRGIAAIFKLGGGRATIARL